MASTSEELAKVESEQQRDHAERDDQPRGLFDQAGLFVRCARSSGLTSSSPRMREVHAIHRARVVPCRCIPWCLLTAIESIRRHATCT